MRRSEIKKITVEGNSNYYVKVVNLIKNEKNNRNPATVVVLINEENNYVRIFLIYIVSLSLVKIVVGKHFDRLRLITIF